MKIMIKATMCLILAFGVSGQIVAQADTNTDNHAVTICVPEVAILDIESTGATAIKLQPEAPEEAGEALDFTNSTNSDLWLNYSSIIGKTTENTRNITVAITSEAVPAGLELTVSAGADAAGGEGTMGTSAGEVTLSSTAQKLVSDIGSAYTGDGSGKGHNLTYTLKKKDGAYGDLDFDLEPTLTVTYTLTDN